MFRLNLESLKIKRARNSHLLFKDLWKNIKPVIAYYAGESGEILKEIDIAESYIKEIKSIDKNGDVFRYPCSYSLEYRLNGEVIDFNNAYVYFQSIFNFLDGCDCMLDNIKDFENEMESYWQD